MGLRQEGQAVEEAMASRGGAVIIRVYAMLDAGVGDANAD